VHTVATLSQVAEFRGSEPTAAAAHRDEHIASTRLRSFDLGHLEHRGRTCVSPPQKLGINTDYSNACTSRVRAAKTIRGDGMPGKRKPGPSVKDDQTYEALRDEGASKEKAARIANAGAQGGRSRSSVGARGGNAGSYDDWKVSDLRKHAKELGLSGYSNKNKSELVSILRDH
jgi:hypothetical protein